MKKFLTIAFLSVCALPAFAIGGNMSYYPDFNEYEPTSPFKSPAECSAFERENYRSDVEEYARKAEDYVRNANDDIEEIQQAAQEAIQKANRVVEEYNMWVNRY